MLEGSGRHGLKGIRIDFDCRVLVDQIQSENEAHTAALPDQNAFDALHQAGRDAHLFANNEIRVRLNLPAEETRTQKLHLGVCYRNIVPAIANDVQDPGGLREP